MSLPCPPAGWQLAGAAPVKTGCQRRKFHRLLPRAYPAMSRNIQADFHAARVKTPAPVQFTARPKIMPFKTGSRPADTPMQMSPAIPHRPPSRTLAKRGGGRVGSAVRFWHGPSVPSYSPPRKCLAAQSSDNDRNLPTTPPQIPGDQPAIALMIGSPPSLRSS